MEEFRKDQNHSQENHCHSCSKTDKNVIKAMLEGNMEYLNAFSKIDDNWKIIAKCFMKLFTDNVNIPISVTEYVEELLTEYRCQKDNNKLEQSPNYDKFIEMLLEDLTNYIQNNEERKHWMLLTLHEFSIIGSYYQQVNHEDKNVWLQLLFITNQLIFITMNNADFTGLNIPEVIMEYIFAVIEKKPKKPDNFEKAYYKLRDRYSLEKMLVILKEIDNIEITKEDGSLALLRILQVCGENIKNTNESPNLSEETCSKLLTSDAKEQLMDCRDVLSHSKFIPSIKKIDKALLSNIRNNLKPLKNSIKNILANNYIDDAPIDLADCLKHLKTRLEIEGNTDETNTILKNICQNASLQDFKHKPILLTAVSTLLLCILTKMDLKENKYWKLESYPTLIGRQLRNHLAHDGCYGLIPINEMSALYYCAEKLQAEADYDQKQTNPLDENEMIKIYEAKKSRLEELDNFWKNIKENKLIEVKQAFDNDYTILFARCLTDKKHVLHFAAEAGYDMIKRIMTMLQVLNIKSTILENILDINGYNILHVAVISNNISSIKAIRELCKNISPNLQCKKLQETALHMGVKTRNIEVIRELLKFEEVDLNFQNNVGYTAIHVAVKYDDVSSIELFLQKLKPPSIDDITTIDGETCLHLAAKYGSLKVAEFLLYRKCDVNKLNKKSNMTPLHFAVFKGDLNMIKLLFNYGAHINNPNVITPLESDSLPIQLYLKNFKTTYESSKIAQISASCNVQIAFWKALLNGNSEDVERYLTTEVSLNLCSSDNGNSAIHFAVQNDNIGGLSLIIERCNINARNYKNETALHIAVASNHIEAICMLLENEINIELYDHQGFKAIHLAIQCGYTEIVQELLEAHKRNNIKTNSIRTLCNKTCLEIACKNQHIDIIKILRDNGATPGKTHDKTENLIHLAIRLKNMEIIRLITQKDNINVKDMNGNTALHLAAREGNLELCDFLIDFGAYSEITNKEHQTPLEVAKFNNQLEIVDYLQTKETVDVANICQKIKEKDLKYFQNFFAKRLELIKLMRDSNGKTLLHCAVENYSLAIASYILENAKSLENVVDGNGQSVLHSAVMINCVDCSKKCSKDLIQFILENCPKFKIALCDSNGKSALHLAIEIKNKCAAEELLPLVTELPNDLYYKILVYFDEKIMQTFLNHLLMNVNKSLMSSSDGTTLLHLASKIKCKHPGDKHCNCKQIEAVEYLIDKQKANVNIQNSYKSTPLHIAATNGHVQLIKKLIEKDANVNALSDLSVPSLTLATRRNHVEATRILVDNYANTNEPNWRLRTSLYDAIQNNNTEITEILVDNGASLTNGWPENIPTKINEIITNKQAQFKEHLSKFWKAIENCDLSEVTKLLAEGMFPCTAKCIETGKNALHFAINSNVEVFQYLSNYKQLKYVHHNTDNEGNTILHAAIMANKMEIVDYIIKNHSLSNIINAQNNKAQTALHLAIINKHYNILDKFISVGANTNISDNEKNYPIHLAMDIPEVVQSLIKGGADVNVGNMRNHTPLHIAAMIGQTDMAELLLGNMADVNASNNDLCTPLHIAVMYRHKNVTKLLIERGAEVNVADDKYYTPLHISALYGLTKISKMLIEHGANVHAVDKNKNTPLHLAAIQGHIDIVKLLIENEAKINACNINNSTPLHRASMKGHIEIVKLLIANNADLSICHNKYSTALHWADLKGHVEVVKVLNNALGNKV